MKKIYPKFEEIDAKILFKAMKKAYDNADDYYYEAELLYRIRSYGHSLALSALGIEELGKSIAYLLLLSEKIIPGSFSNSEDFTPNILLKKIHQSHKDKQSLSVMYSLLSDIFLNDSIRLTLEIEEKGKENISFVYVINQIRKIQQNAVKRSKSVKRWEKDFEFIQKIQKLKENGMYVEIDTNPIKLSIPQKIKAKDSMKCLDILDKYTDLLEYIPYLIWDESVDTLLSESIKK